MAIGATWDTSLAEQNGTILGSELSKVGINLLFGPSLDVLELPLQEGGEDLGTRTFGGDPYWVGEMGKAFIKGVHTGSNMKVAVTAKYFPGRGGSDRPLEEEVATVRKSLEQLKQIELAPFFAVTNKSIDRSLNTEGLMVSHIRYQGFQGNIRVTTRPVSLDPSALSLILSLPEFSPWYQEGGIIISDDLGSEAVRRFNDPTLLNFDPRQTARNAFLAGNDLLFVDNISTGGSTDSYTSIVNTLDYFEQKYKEDLSFAQRVDASVLKILTLKYSLYPDFSLQSIIPSADQISEIGNGNQVVLQTAQSSAALINPSLLELPNVLPDPPDYRERIIFLMDSSEYQQCSTCEIQTDLPANSLKEAVVKFYGSTAGNQINPLRLSAYPFKNIKELLSGLEVADNFESDLRQADWVVVGLQKVDVNRPNSLAFKQLLAERSELLRNKKVIVFAFNAPYYLDATDISKVTAYYAMYSKSQPFIDLAALILFQEVAPHSASPVSIPGVGYELINVMAPDPEQIIPLSLDLPEQSAITPELTLTLLPATEQKFKLGDTIPIRTGVIVDHNQHQVPDGTPVRFIIKTEADASTTQQIEATTFNGIARASYRIATNGFIEIRVISEPALTSALLQLDIPVGEGAAITAVAPTSIPTETLVPSITPTISATSELAGENEVTGQPTFWEWLLVILIIGIISSLIYSIGRKIHSIRWGVRWALCSILGGLSSYIYLTGSLPGGEAWLKLTGTTGLLVVIMMSMSIGLAAGVLWHAASQNK
jgi:beta-N-acetylhexosaminidase